MISASERRVGVVEAELEGRTSLVRSLFEREEIRSASKSGNDESVGKTKGRSGR